MKTIRIIPLALLMLAACVRLTAAASPTSLTVTAPAGVGTGEDITVQVRLRTAAGEPLAGVPLTLFQVGAVGEREMAQATTDGQGVVTFLHTEYTLAHLSLRVRFAGDVDHAPAAAQVDVEISGIDVPPSVVMAHTPDPLVKAILFAILGAVWLTYAFAGSCIIRIMRQRNPEGVGARGTRW